MGHPLCPLVPVAESLIRRGDSVTSPSEMANPATILRVVAIIDQYVCLAEYLTVQAADAA